MRELDSVIVTPKLLNEVGTLAAPRMLAIAHGAGLAALSETERNTMMLVGYSAEFKEGARENETVNVVIEEAEGLWPGDKAFRLSFSKGTDATGRVGKWQLIFAQKHESRPLPYNLNQAVADGLTDRELWRPDPIVATGDAQQDAPRLLWPIGQSARSYMKRLDLEFVSQLGAKCADDVPQRIYAGIAVTVNLAHWPSKGQELRCALQHQPPLKNQSDSKRLEFHGVLVSQDQDEIYLLGTCCFSVSRLSQHRVPIFADGATERG